MIYLIETRIRKRFLDDPELRFLDIGILYHILSRPLEWRWHWKEIWKQGKGGRVQIQKSLALLKKRGYLCCWNEHDQHGHFNQYHADATDISFENELRHKLIELLPIRHPWKPRQQELSLKADKETKKNRVSRNWTYGGDHISKNWTHGTNMTHMNPESRLIALRQQAEQLKGDFLKNLKSP